MKHFPSLRYASLLTSCRVGWRTTNGWLNTFFLVMIWQSVLSFSLHFLPSTLNTLHSVGQNAVQFITETLCSSLAWRPYFYSVCFQCFLHLNWEPLGQKNYCSSFMYERWPEIQRYISPMLMTEPSWRSTAVCLLQWSSTAQILMCQNGMLHHVTQRPHINLGSFPLLAHLYSPLRSLLLAHRAAMTGPLCPRVRGAYQCHPENTAKARLAAWLR